MGFDFYRTLHDLLQQIPEGMATIFGDLAEAMGDSNAAPAISQALKREEYKYAQAKVVKGTPDKREIFRNFTTDRPLARLADLQLEACKRVIPLDLFESAELVAGVDVAYSDDSAYAACVVLDGNSRIVDVGKITTKVSFPYISGFLAFREAPAIEAAVKRVSRFDVLMVNGHGLAHPRGCGVACQVGIDLDKPTIGIASRLMVGRADSPVNGWSPIIHEGRVVGGKLKTKGFARVYVSVGHKISLETAVEIVRRTQISGGTPEPLRIAHVTAVEMKRADEASAARL